MENRIATQRHSDGSKYLSARAESYHSLKEINGTVQDILRIAFNFSHKWKQSRPLVPTQFSDYDKDISPSVPKSNTAEHQYLFHNETMEKIGNKKQATRNKRISEQPLTTKNVLATLDLNFTIKPTVVEISTAM
ncbi:hypothetical protein AYI68_g7716 [Smittium mucronatum]|uniref:Uncharacterized protein n=1 Tax=Smittium mucronatum TaxID=133383 RepID=A0A1R0GMZ5_9FUNG|nr:hypothetical protein AYI68_g7716 [Smittium mucronatum]